MWESGLADPRLIPSYFAALLSMVLIVASIRRLSNVGREAKRPRNRSLHRLKWLGLATCLSVIFVKSIVRIWYIATAQGPYLVDKSWWAHLWIIFVLTGVGTAGLAAYLWWSERPFPRGHCQKCGYNLTGNVTGVCPECGAVT
jgi:drug/metabolite transporter (DMT)-like permease